MNRNPAWISRPACAAPSDSDSGGARQDDSLQLARARLRRAPLRRRRRAASRESWPQGPVSQLRAMMTARVVARRRHRAAGHHGRSGTNRARYRRRRRTAAHEPRGDAVDRTAFRLVTAPVPPTPHRQRHHLRHTPTVMSRSHCSAHRSCPWRCFVTFFVSTSYLSAFVQLPGPTALSALSDRFLFIAASIAISALAALMVWDALGARAA